MIIRQDNKNILKLKFLFNYNLYIINNKESFYFILKDNKGITINKNKFTSVKSDILDIKKMFMLFFEDNMQSSDIETFIISIENEIKNFYLIVNIEDKKTIKKKGLKI